MKQLCGLIAMGILIMSSRALADPPKAGDTAKDFALRTIEGKSVGLAELKKAGPVVLVVLRGYPGYQCPLCTKQVRELTGKAKEFAGAGASVVMVYPGPAEKLGEHASEFLGNSALPEGFTLVIDPDYTFTTAYDLRWDKAAETAYPSTFVIDRTGKVVYAKVSHTHGDRAATKDVLAALSDAK